MKKLFAIASVLILISSCADATENYNYINPKLISPEFLTHPLPNGSEKLKREAVEIIKIQKAATKDEIAQAQLENKFTPELVVDEIKGHPATYKIIHKAADDCKTIVSNTKNYWQITRPYLADDNIKALITPTESYAYPSGHTACSLVVAEIWGQTLRDYNQDAYVSLQIADKIAQNRVLGGMHWPQDVAGGKELGMLIFGALQTSGKYQADLAAAKKEWPKETELFDRDIKGE